MNIEQRTANQNSEHEPGTGNLEPGTVLVTGASGFAGGHLVEHLTRLGQPVMGWGRKDVDLLDAGAVRAGISALKPALVYHCAGAPHVAESWAAPAVPLRTNVLATHHLLDAIRRAGEPCRVLIPGSATVYVASPDPIDEDALLAPASPYALSKLAQEQLGIRALAEDGVEVVVTRSFNHTGPRQPPAFAAPSFARQIARIEAGLAEPVLRAGNLETRRDLTDVRDMVRAYALLMAGGRPGVPYNVCSGEAYAIGDVLEGLRARAGVTIHVEVDPSRLRPNDPPVVVGNPARLRAETGWTREIPFDRMLDDLLNYWRDQVEA